MWGYCFVRRQMIGLVKVKESFYNLCKQNSVDEELLFNECGRPCVLLVRLMYRSKNRDFVVPLRSNISAKTPVNQYLSLPPNPTTKPNHKHGLHYYKLFPIDKKYIDRYQVAGDTYYTGLLQIINRKEPDIVQACQDYLKLCEQGEKHFITPNLDGIISVLES